MTLAPIGRVAAALKDHLRITTTDEDDYLVNLIDVATAAAESYIGCAIISTEHTERVLVGRNTAVLRVKHRPIDPTEPITITDPGGVDYDADWFELRPWGFASPYGYSGRQILTPGLWTVTYTGGLSARDDYASVIAPLVEQAVTLKAAALYLDRNPLATAERDGDQSVNLDLTADPFALIARYRVAP